MLVHEAALLGIPVDTGRLFDGDDHYELWLWAIVRSVKDTLRRQG
jgi:hypothetical protein